MNSYIKDSANNYTLYIDQGTDVSFDIPASSFGLSDISNYIFSGQIRVHPSSVFFVEFNIVRIISSNSKIILKLSEEQTQSLKNQRYSFNVLYKHMQTGEMAEAISGTVIVSESVTMHMAEENETIVGDIESGDSIISGNIIIDGGNASSTY